jgi:hypothetical protein
MRKVSITGRRYGDVSGSIASPGLTSAAPAVSAAEVPSIPRQFPSVPQWQPIVPRKRSLALVDALTLTETSYSNLAVLLSELNDLAQLSGGALAVNQHHHLPRLKERLEMAETVLDQAVAEMAALVGAVPNPPLEPGHE